MVPYINISDKIFSKLQEANLRGVETIIVYRENKLHDKVKEKLFTLDNLNLMHHPNLHAKCYYNEKYLIIGSMNLYEYSEKNNREMGVLLHKQAIDDANKTDGDNVTIFRDAVEEIRDVIKSSELEKKSRDTIENGFELDIIKTEAEKILELCKVYNKFFHNKFFEPNLHNGNYIAYCKNYYDRIDVSIESRITLYLNLPDYHLKDIYSKFMVKYNEYMYQGFKLYWNFPFNKVSIYLDSRHGIWKSITDEQSKFDQYRGVISNFLNDIKLMMIMK